MRIIRYHNSPRYVPSVSYPSLRAEMDRLFEVAFPALTNGGFFDAPRNDFPVDFYQDKDAYTLRAELPGFRKEDVGIEVADGVLTVTATQKTEAKSETKDEAAAPAQQERRVTRAVSLPENLALDQIKAVYENGVLTVTLPKREEVKPKQIAIEVK